MKFPKINWAVVFAAIILAFALGVANNFRVFEEKRVSLWGMPGNAEDAAK